MFKVLYGGFSQETNTFSPQICTRELFEAGSICFGQDIIDGYYGKDNHVAGMLNYLCDASDIEVIPTAYFGASSYGRVDQTVIDEFIEYMLKEIEKNKPFDGIFLTLHGGMSTTESDEGVGLILDALRKAAGDDVVIAASTDLHAVITPLMMKNLDILCGFHEYPHTDIYNTGLRAAKLGAEILRTGVRPAMACCKLPMILQAEASTTKSGPLFELVQEYEKKVEEGLIKDFTIYHMQPWMDIDCAGAAVVVIANEPETAKSYAEEIGKKYFDLRHVLKYTPLSIDDGLDLAIGHKTGELVVLSDAADNTSGGATGDSVEVLRHILDRELDIRAALVVCDEPACDKAMELGEGAEAEFTVGGTLDPRFYKPLTHMAKVIKICDPIVTFTTHIRKGLTTNFGKAAILRMRNTDVIVCKYPQANFYQEQFTGFGLKLEDYDMVQVKSSLAYVDRFKDVTSQMYNVATPGSCTSDLISLNFTRIPRPMYPFDDTDDFGPAPAYLARQ